MASMVMKSVGWFRADPNNPRKSADEADLDRLGDDLLARGVLVPLLARPDGTIIDGWRRWLAAQRKGIKELPVIVTDRELTENELRGNQLATVFHRADLTPYEKWLACSELMGMNAGWQMKDLADFLHVDRSMCTRLMSASRCVPAVQEALAAGRIGLSTVYAISKCDSAADQERMLAQALSGASRDAIEQAGRKTRKTTAAGQAVKVSRVKIAMPEATLVITGKKLSMAEVVELLSEALKEARKAADQFDVKTFVSIMRDKSKAG